MFKNVALLGLIGVFGACSMLGPKPTTAYHRTDINQPVQKLIVFPVTNFSGIQDDNAKKIEAAFTGKWAELYGKENVLPGGPVIFKMMETMGKDTYGKFISSLDNVSSLEQLLKNPMFRNFTTQVTKQLGNYHFALAIVNGDEASYNSKNPVRVHIGLFDSTNLTWKWITKIEDQKGIVGNWEASSLMMVNNSFDLINKLEKTATRDIASEKK